MSYNNDDDGGKNTLFAFVLSMALAVLVLWMGFNTSRAEEHNMKKDCTVNMSKKQVAVCLSSMRFTVEEMTEQTKQLLADIEPIKLES